MRFALLLLAGFVVAAPLAACQSTGEDGGLTYSRSNANRAKTSDPIAALKKY